MLATLLTELTNLQDDGYTVVELSTCMLCLSTDVTSTVPRVVCGGCASREGCMFV